jgi:hypothetical protein
MHGTAIVFYLLYLPYSITNITFTATAAAAAAAAAAHSIAYYHHTLFFLL